ncbi:Wzz/FepE/Etk N-terminal domain-containing protein [Aquirufa sp. ROCK2-A2]
MAQIQNRSGNQSNEKDEVSIDLKELFQSIIFYKWRVLLMAVVFALLGALYSLTSPNEYISTVKLLPEIDSKSSGGLGGLKSLAGLAGIDLSSSVGTEAIRPDLYPNILQSTPFLQSIVNRKIYVSKKNNWVVLGDLLSKDRIEAPLSFGKSEDENQEDEDKHVVLPSGALANGLVNMDKKSQMILMNLKSRITAELDKKSGVITISVKLTDPVAAANVSYFAQQYLTDYVTKYRTEKSVKEVNFLKKRQEEAKSRYDQALHTLSNYRDQNRNLFLNVAKDQEKKLQYEVDLSYNLYSSLNNQLADAQIKTHRETPVIKVLEPAQVPVQKSGPKRAMLTIGFMFFGILIALISILLKTVNLKQLF